MRRVIMAAAMLAGLIIGCQAEAEGCGPCIKEDCPPSNDCRAGFVPDRCGCCMVCGRIEGEKCDNRTARHQHDSYYGPCGENLACLLRDDLEDLDIIEAVCVCKKEGAVCGTDGRTYASVCKLKQEAAQLQTELGVKEWSPCETAPLITSKPENVTANINDDLALSCEVRGYPIPSLIWEFESALTGRKIKLPGDDQMIALQVRGGPEPFMVSSWIQILRVRASDAGVYSCTVVSKKGIVRAEATVQVTKRAKVADKKPAQPPPVAPVKSSKSAKKGPASKAAAPRKDPIVG